MGNNDKWLVIITLGILGYLSFYFGSSLGEYINLGFFGFIGAPLLNLVGGAIGVLIAFILGLFIVIALFIDVQNYQRFMLGVGLFALVIAYIFNPIDIPGPVDDLLVAFIGTGLGARSISQSTKNKPEQVIPQF